MPDWTYEERHTGPTTRSGRCRQAALAVLIPLAIVGALAWAFLTSPAGGDVDTDEQALALVQERLAPVLTDFDAVTLPEGIATSTGPATIESCSTDSGDVFQPSALRVWNLPPTTTDEDAVDAVPAARQAVLLIAEQLRGQGWSGGEAFDPAGWTDLTLPGDGYTVTANVGAYGGRIVLDAEVPPAACA